ncbi:ATP-dependent Clp protease ATP-binding subunit [Candidatus Parcubacteria bacterium]|nr:MAG: ATP-dependent Clp protease ATP-binding subunit [Candidatus Parcubacteria bacterium]
MQNTERKIINCPSCLGEGVKGSKKCKQCNGLGFFLWTGSQLIFWGKRIDAAAIYQDSAKTYLKKLIDLALLIICSTGMAAGIYFFYQLQLEKIPLYEFYLYPSWLMVYFWFALLLDTYMYFRLVREIAQLQNYIKKPEPKPNIHHALDWHSMTDLASAKKVNIADYFSHDAMEMVTKSWKLAKKYGHPRILPIHFLIIAMSYQQSKIMFGRLGVNYQKLKEKIIHSLSKVILPPSEDTILSRPALEILLESYVIAMEATGKKVEIAEIISALAKIENPVKEIFYDLEIDFDKVDNVAAWVRIRKKMYERYQRFRKKAHLKPSGDINRSMTAVATPILDAFSQDLTTLAKYGYLSPCVGRNKEIEEIFRIIEGGTRRAVILTGNPGTGRRTIIDGIAQMMTEENVPDLLQDKRLVSLSLAKLIGGVTPSEAGQRLLMALNEVIRSGNIVLFIHDIHNMVGITSGSEKSSLDLASTLASFMTRSRLVIFATTTYKDYIRYVENSSLGNVFEKIEIDEPKGNNAIQILEVKTGSIEYRNGVYFSYDAVAGAAKLSDRYLHDRFLPEKAIEIMEEAAVKVHKEKGKNSIVTADDIALIITEKTKIPLSKITEKETEKLLHLEQLIHQRMIDQEEAVKMIADALRRSRAGMGETTRPIANLLFLGPTGVGKTELAKTVADIYFGSEKNMIRLDMTEYQDKSSIYRLIGDNSGNPGYLTEAIRKNSFSLLLLDEIEKANSELINIFLQVMDDGRLTDGLGRTVDFTNVVLIGTSNANSVYIQNRVKEGASGEQIKDELLEGRLVKHFRPEFLNRLDGIIVFKPLSREDVKQIALLQIKKIADNLAVKGINLEVTESGLKELAEQGYDPEYGARPLKRVIQEKLADSITNLLLEGKITRRDKIVYDVGGMLKIKQAEKL